MHQILNNITIYFYTYSQKYVFQRTHKVLQRIMLGHNEKKFAPYVNMPADV